MALDASHTPLFVRLSLLAGVREQHHQAVWGFLAFGQVLGAFFLLVPLREECGLSVGTSQLPALFTASLAVTWLASPLAAWLVGLPSMHRGRGFRCLCHFFAVLLLAFFCAFRLLDSHRPAASSGLPAAPTAHQALHPAHVAHGLQAGRNGPVLRQAGKLLRPPDSLDPSDPLDASHLVDWVPPAGSLAGVQVARKLSAAYDTGAGAWTGMAAGSGASLPADAGTPHQAVHGGADGPAYVMGTPPAARSHNETEAAAAAVAAAASAAMPGSRRDAIQQAHPAPRMLFNAFVKLPATAAALLRLVRPQVAVAVCFYVVVGLMNILLVSAGWGVAACVFSARAGKRAFGFLSSGATCGQLLGSVACMGYLRVASVPGHMPYVLLLPAAMLLLSAAHATTRMAASAAHTPSASTADSSGAALPPLESPLSAAACSSASHQHTSAAAHLLFDSQPQPRQQLPAPAHWAAGAESVKARAVTTENVLASPAAHSAATTHMEALGRPPVLRPSLLRRLTHAWRRRETATDATQHSAQHSTQHPKDSPQAPQHAERASARPGEDGSKADFGGGLWRRPGEGGREGGVLRAAWLVWRSPYLQLSSAFLAANSLLSASLYLMRQAVVAHSMRDVHARLSFFAALSSAAGGVILGLQLVATGRVLCVLGVPGTLLVGPLVSCGGMLLCALQPSLHAIAGFEVLRKVVQYSLSRPCREVLFTVVSAEEASGAKLLLDTMVQRAGDAAAAALFHAVSERMGAASMQGGGGRASVGLRAVAWVGVGLSCLWGAAAWRLGRMYVTREQEASLPRQTKCSV